MNCNHCGGRMWVDRENWQDAPVLKCMACSRTQGEPRPHEEPARMASGGDYIPGMGVGFNHKEGADERRLQRAREYWHRKKAG